jgi:hypothetical protein
MKIGKSRIGTYVLQGLGCVACGGVGYVLAVTLKPCTPRVEAASSVAAPVVVPSAEASVEPKVLSDAQERIRELEAKVSELSAQVARASAQAGTGDSSEVIATDGDQASKDEQAQRDEALAWKVSAVEKFVPLTEEQKLRLRKKYEAEANGQSEGVETDTLEEIIGQENATFYRQQVKAAFQKVRDEELNKEVVWLARQLNLSAQQEQAMQQTFLSIEEQLAQGDRAAASSHDRVKAMIEENRKRNDLRAAQMKELLSPEQYQAYAKSQADSSSSDVEVFHDSGGK